METDRLLPKNEEEEPPPRDRSMLVYIIMYWLGVATLLPWNFFSNAKMYFLYKLRNTSLDTNTTIIDYHPPAPEDETELQTMFEGLLTLCAMVPNVGFMYLNTISTSRISLRFRIITSALVMISLFIFAITLTQINTDAWQMTFLVLTMATITFMNAASAVLQGATFGLAGMMPKKYTQAVMGGMGMGGTIAAGANIFCVWVGSNPWQTGFGYFLCATICLALGLVGYLILPALKFYRHYTDYGKKRTVSQSVNSETDTMDTQTEASQTESYSSESGVETAILPASTVPEKKTWCFLISKILMYGACVFFTFCITLSCFPAVNSAIKSTARNRVWSEYYFMPVTCFFMFNFFDWVGRTLVTLVMWPKENNRIIILLCALRIVFIPLFLMCNVQPRVSLPVWFEHDAYPAVFMTLFAMSNGYLGTLCMMYGPNQADKADKERAASIMSFCLSSGLAAGALISFCVSLVFIRP